MGDVPISAWFLFCGFVVLASFAGASLANIALWRSTACVAGVRLSLGILLGPFLVGICSVLVLSLLPGLSNAMFVSAVGGLLILLSLFPRVITRRRNPGTLDVSVTPETLPTGRLFTRTLACILLLWSVGLLVNATLLPLLQNDSLEYAMVAREVYLARSLSVYPLLDAQSSSSGFFAPWTHPPLYVSMITLMYAIQGHALDPGLMRMIAPWFLGAAVFCTFTIGRLHSLRLGLLAAILLFSAPLLFLGADSGLLDALPVASLVMLMAIVLGVKSDTRSYPVALGVALGLALWTHSQAILLIALLASAVAIQFGLLKIRRSSFVMLVAVGLALLIAGAPYVRNYLIFGSPISDNPSVFALPELDWKGYFEFNRGLDHGVAIFQYGVLKGLFSLEAYGLVFWAWLLGSGFFVWLIGLKGMWSLLFHGYESDAFRHRGACGATRPEICLPFVIVFTYLLGVIASVGIGVDLMIRNERYMLMIVPAVALGAAFAIVCILDWVASAERANVWKIARNIFVSGLLVLFVLQLLMVAGVYRWRYGERVSLDHWPGIKVVQAINREVAEGEFVLSMRPANMYYANRPMVSYLDERMLDFYLQKNVCDGMKELKRLGVTHVSVSDYLLPPEYNSVLPDILANPRLSRLVYSSDGDQLYELVPEDGLTQARTQVNFLEKPWARVSQLRLGGRKVLETLGVAGGRIKEPVSESTVPFFHRDYSVLLVPGGADTFLSTDTSTMIGVESGQYILNIDAVGRSYVSVWMQRFNEDGTFYRSETIADDQMVRVGDFSLTDRRPEQVFKRRIQIDPGVRWVRFAIEHTGRSNIRINSMTLERLVSDDEGATRNVMTQDVHAQQGFRSFSHCEDLVDQASL